MNEKIHIGTLIRNKMKEEQRSASWLAERINCNTRNVYKIYDKQSINSDLLRQISEALGTNLFAYYPDNYDDKHETK
jgi:plasmid maintenance system antidote protein VapI